MPESVIDHFDEAILKIMQRNNLTPAREMAEQIGLSESAILRRVRNLRKEGVIVRDISLVKNSDQDRKLTIIVLVSLLREGLAQIESFSAALRQREEVVACWYVTGDEDFVVVLMVDDMGSYETFSQEVFLADPNISRFKTMFAMRNVIPSLFSRL